MMVMMSRIKDSFEELELPRRDVPKLSARYRVYKSRNDFITVEAESAMDAYKKCGLSNVLRIERDAIYLNNVINLEALVAMAHTPAEPETPAVDTPLAAASAEAPAQETPAAALSNTDVDQLLTNENANADA